MGLLFVDSTGGIYRTDIDTGRTVRLADFTQSWTDIAVTPTGRIFTTTFNGLYEINLTTGTAQFVRSLAGSANGLASDAQGRLYVGSASSNQDILVLSPTNFSVVDTIALPTGVSSSGDIHINGNTLFFSTNARAILSIDLRTEQVISNVYHGISNLFGLHSENGIFYGLARNDIYQINPKTGAVTLIDELPIGTAVYGAATLAGVTIRGTSGADTLFADDGGSTIYGFAGRDLLIGGRTADKLFGGAGRDYLFGNGGHDSIYGGDGRDVLDGGRGNDKLLGGAGIDSFVFETGDGRDVIADFQNNIDTIEISAAILGARSHTVKTLLDTFGSVVDGDVVLDFGTFGRIVVENVSVKAALLDDILLF